MQMILRRCIYVYAHPHSCYISPQVFAQEFAFSNDYQGRQSVNRRRPQQDKEVQKTDGWWVWTAWYALPIQWACWPHINTHTHTHTHTHMRARWWWFFYFLWVKARVMHSHYIRVYTVDCEPRRLHQHQLHHADAHFLGNGNPNPNLTNPNRNRNRNPNPNPNPNLNSWTWFRISCSFGDSLTLNGVSGAISWSRPWQCCARRLSATLWVSLAFLCIHTEKAK